MDVRHEIDQLAATLLPSYETRASWPIEAQETTDRLFAILVGMYLANQLSGRQVKELVEQVRAQERAQRS